MKLVQFGICPVYPENARVNLEMIISYEFARKNAAIYFLGDGNKPVVKWAYNSEAEALSALEYLDKVCS